MNVFRGPSSKSFYDGTHEFVSRIPPEQLEEGIRSKALIRFNITKDGVERQAVCTAQFEDADIVPMIDGLVSRLKLSQECLGKIRKAMDDKEATDKEKLAVIKSALTATK
jgi:hypothetical protein